MNKQQFDVFVNIVNAQLGNPRMTWEGPEPHDFRDMEARGVKFVHSELYAKVPLSITPDSDYAPHGKVHFKILVGSIEDSQSICKAISDAGWMWNRGEPGPHYHAIEFEVPVCG